MNHQIRNIPLWRQIRSSDSSFLAVLLRMKYRRFAFVSGELVSYNTHKDRHDYKFAPD